MTPGLFPANELEQRVLDAVAKAIKHGEGKVVVHVTGGKIVDVQTLTKPKEMREGKPERHKHGTNGHVLLTNENYAALRDEWGKEYLDKLIKSGLKAAATGLRSFRNALW